MARLAIFETRTGLGLAQLVYGASDCLVEETVLEPVILSCCYKPMDVGTCGGIRIFSLLLAPFLPADERAFTP